MSDERAREALLAALDDDAADPVALSALADWFEEQGDGPAAACLRWVVRNRRRPGCHAPQTFFGKFFWERQGLPALNDPLAQLPEGLWLSLGDNDEPYHVGSFKSYRSPRAAYLALVDGWKRLGRPVPEMGAAGA